jgi:hypothetical protein
MKISPKPPPASRPAEPPAKGGNTGIVPPKHGNTGIVPPKHGNTGIVPPKHGNTGIVPPKHGNTGIVPPHGNTGIVPPGATQPKDGFQPATGTGGKGGTSAASGTSATSTIASTPSDYALAPKLEQFRHLFDQEGERISKLPTEQQAGEIELTSSRLFEQLKDYGTFDEVKSGVTASTAFYSRGSGGNDPMTYAMAANVAADFPTGGGSVSVEGSGDFGTSFKPAPAPREESSLPSTGKPQRAEEETHQRFRRMRRHF